MSTKSRSNKSICFGSIYLRYEAIHSVLKVSFSDIFKICCFYNMCVDTVDVSTLWLLF